MINYLTQFSKKIMLFSLLTMWCSVGFAASLKVDEHSHKIYQQEKRKVASLQNNLDNIRQNIVNKNITNEQATVLLNALMVTNLTTLLANNLNEFALLHDLYVQSITSNKRIFTLEHKVDTVNAQLKTVIKNQKKQIAALNSQLNDTNQKLLKIERKMDLSNRYLARIARNTTLPE